MEKWTNSQCSETEMTGFFIGFGTGIATGFIANYLYERYKEWRRGKEPFISTRVSGGLIQFEGQIKNTTTGQTAVNKLNRTIDANETQDQ